MKQELHCSTALLVMLTYRTHIASKLAIFAHKPCSSATEESKIFAAVRSLVVTNFLV